MLLSRDATSDWSMAWQFASLTSPESNSYAPREVSSMDFPISNTNLSSGLICL